MTMCILKFPDFEVISNVHGCLFVYVEMSNQELIQAGNQTMNETDQAIERSKQVVQNTVEVGTQTAATLKGQVSASLVLYC